MELAVPVWGGNVRGRYGPLARKTVVTAVGDNKQQIMRWAMAMDEPFVEYERDFGAKRVDHRQVQRASKRRGEQIGFELRCAERIFISLNIRQCSDFPEPPQTVTSSERLAPTRRSARGVPQAGLA
jgi:hypothetical protein